MAYFHTVQSVRLVQVLRLYESATSLDTNSQDKALALLSKSIIGGLGGQPAAYRDRLTSTELGVRPIIDDFPLVPLSSAQPDPEDVG